MPKTPISRTRSQRIFHQCMGCGALVDSMFGWGDGSWCPYCHMADLIVCTEGQVPNPQQYGQWLLEQEKAPSAQASNARPSPASVLSSSPIFNLMTGASAMKLRITHTGKYCCPECCIEYNLIAEESLKCDKCSGPLFKGTLDEVLGDQPDPNQE